MMDETWHINAALRGWTGPHGGRWFMMDITGQPAEALAGHALAKRLETGRARGFGSVALCARIGNSTWRTAAFPTGDGAWIVLIKAAIRRDEHIVEGDRVDLYLQPV